MRTACIIGFTGLIGQHLFELLSNSNEFSKIYLVGRKQPAKLPSHCEFIYSELKDLEKLTHLQADHWFCTLGTTISRAGSQDAFKAVDLDGVLGFARLAIKGKCKSLHIVSAIGANSQSQVFYTRIKGQMEKQVTALSPPGLRFYNPSLLLGDRKDFRLGEKLAILAAPLYSPFLMGPMKKYKPIEALAVAQNMLNDSLTF